MRIAQNLWSRRELRPRENPRIARDLDSPAMAGGARGPSGSHVVAGLLERERELAVLLGAIDAAATGAGSVVLLEGAAGIGKSRLLAEVADRSHERIRIVAVQCHELEASLPWWLARSILGPLLDELPPGRRRRTLERAGGEPLELLVSGRRLPEGASDPAQQLGRAHALTWLLSDLAEHSPLALLVDDLHWADEPSQDFLAYLAGRVQALPIALILAQRPPQPGQPAELLGRLTSVSGVETLELAALTGDGVAELARAELDDVSPEVQATLLRTTGGNPLYVRELSRALAATRAEGLPLDAEAVRAAAPSGVIRSVTVRVTRLGADAVALAEAVAVLGSGAGLGSATELAGIDDTRAAAALQRLAAEQILLGELPLRFVHPVIATAVDQGMGVARRSALHLRAAHLLSRDGCDLARVAVHLAGAPSCGDPWVVETLREAAARAVAQGASALAVRYLLRALDEPPPVKARGELLAELGCAEAVLGSPQAPEHLEAALALIEAPERRARLQLELGRSRLFSGDPLRARKAFEEGEAVLGEPESELGRELRAAWWMVAMLDRGANQQALAREIADVEASPAPLSRGQRQLLAQLAQQRAFAGRPPDELRALALRAWSDGALLREETSDGLAWPLVTGTLLVADELELEVEICDAVLADARGRGSPMGFATASYCRAWPLLYRGQVVDAAADAQAALDARRDGWRAYLGCATAIFAAAMLEQGSPGAARTALAEALDDAQLRLSSEFCITVWADGLVLLAEDRPLDALQTLLRAGEGVMAIGIDPAGMIAWRSDASIAAARAGESERAAALAQEALTAAAAGGVPRAIAAALRARSRLEPVEEAIRTLGAAAKALDSSPPRLETAHVLVELGSALRRANQRVAARRPLTEGLGLARWGGVRPLVATAEAELAATGVRAEPAPPGDEARLTPSERRVALLAAQGHSNREIAQMLFVTVKAVEYHLGNTYGKLGILRRGQLSAALSAMDGPREPDRAVVAGGTLRTAG